jgi:antitoxin component YwqK of YwqJK toxin-antitoxin module
MISLLKSKLEGYMATNCVFVTCRNVWIVVLKKTDNTITNEPTDDEDAKNKGIVDKQYSEFTGNEFLVKNIFHKLDDITTTDIVDDGDTIYHKGHIIKADINYFLSYDPPYWYGLNIRPNGLWISWYDNGQVKEEGYYVDNKQIGNWITYYKNGYKESEGVYKNDFQTGKWINWHDNGQKESEGKYKKGYTKGIWISWFENGQMYMKGKVKNDTYSKDCKMWNRDGSKHDKSVDIYFA